MRLHLRQGFKRRSNPQDTVFRLIFEISTPKERFLADISPKCPKPPKIGSPRNSPKSPEIPRNSPKFPDFPRFSNDMCQPRNKERDTRGSLIDYESHKIKRTVLSTTVAELYAFMKCYGSAQFYRGLWMDMTAQPLEVHLRTDANNLVTCDDCCINKIARAERDNTHDTDAPTGSMFWSDA